MGMFNKDREYGNRLDQQYPLGVPFVLLDAKLTGQTIGTSFGDADVAELTTMKVGPDGFATGNEIVCTTVASAIVAKVKEAEPSDFPALVELRRVQSKNYRGSSALVLQFVAPYFDAASRPEPAA